MEAYPRTLGLFGCPGSLSTPFQHLQCFKLPVTYKGEVEIPYSSDLMNWDCLLNVAPSKAGDIAHSVALELSPA